MDRDEDEPSKGGVDAADATEGVEGDGVEAGVLDTGGIETTDPAGIVGSAEIRGGWGVEVDTTACVDGSGAGTTDPAGIVNAADVDSAGAGGDMGLV